VERVSKSVLEARKIIEKGGGVAFTGAGISVESGIPPFRGPNGIWNRYNPEVLDIEFFKTRPAESWRVIKELFYDHFRGIKPNKAHFCLAQLEQEGKIAGVITQNIDNLHQMAGSKKVVEFHGTANWLICLQCESRFPVKEVDLTRLPPRCPYCGGVLKPDFVFFGEPIPEEAFRKSWEWATNCSFMLVIGTSGEVMPASRIPFIAKEYGAKIIEINIRPSAYTNTITDIFIEAPATTGCQLLWPENGGEEVIW
jgi:NAD-dependent deacetylase